MSGRVSLGATAVAIVGVLLLGGCGGTQAEDQAEDQAEEQEWLKEFRESDRKAEQAEKRKRKAEQAEKPKRKAEQAEKRKRKAEQAEKPKQEAGTDTRSGTVIGAKIEDGTFTGEVTVRTKQGEISAEGSPEIWQQAEASLTGGLGRTVEVKRVAGGWEVVRVVP